MPARDQEYLGELSDGLHSLLFNEDFTDVEFLVVSLPRGSCSAPRRRFSASS